jgi:ribosomal protein L11 methyltransferase
VIIVLATTEDGLPDARARLAELGLHAERVLAPSDTRRLLLAPVDDESTGARLVTHLRAEGRPAVLRPAGGAHLDTWDRHTRPITIGTSLTVCFAWSEHDRHDLRNVVELDPGRGFGTGAHPSTRLLLDALAARINGGERLLDVGCGSGVLAVCALKLGASSAVGIDIEAHALEATRRNAALNAVEDHLQVSGTPLAETAGQFDVVVANLAMPTLVDLAPDLLARRSPGGWLAVSGISPAQCSVVAASLRPLRVVEELGRDEWSALVLGA